MTPSLQAESRSELVHAYLFDEHGVGKRIDVEFALNWLKSPENTASQFIWLHFNNPRDIGGNWLQFIEFPEIFRDVLDEGRRSSRLENIRDDLIAVMNDVSYDSSSYFEVATLWVSIGRRRFISAWNRPLRSVQELSELIRSGESFRSPMALVIQLLSNQADVLVEILRNAAATANEIEQRLLTSRLPERTSLGRMRRDLIRQQRLLAPDPAALLRLATHPPKWAEEEDVIRLHLAGDNFSIILRDMFNLQEHIRLLEDEIAARVGEKTNRSLFILTSVTVISLPMTIVAALFGMNVGGLPFRESSYGFAVILLLAILLTIAATLLILRLLRD